MSSMFGGRSRTPTPTSPTPVPTELSPEVRRKAEDFRRRLLKGLGREGTILTGIGGYKGLMFPGSDKLGGNQSSLGSIPGTGPTSTSQVARGGQHGEQVLRLWMARRGRTTVRSVLG
jgi:hypothetical protein